MTQALEAVALLAHAILAWVLARRGLGPLRPGSRVQDWLLYPSLSWLLAAGTSSAGWLLGRLVLGSTPVPRLPVESAVVAGLALVVARFRRTVPPRDSEPDDDFALRRRAPVWFALAGCAALCTAAALVVINVSELPHGNIDATMIWNMRARALATLDADWRRAFEPSPAVVHTDYPLLLPAFVARLLIALGTDSPLVAAGVAVAFTGATAALSFAAVHRLCGAASAWLAVVLLLATSQFIELGAWQYADVPLALGLLASIACLLLGLRPPAPRPAAIVLAGALAGCAAWTKNEGSLFLLALLVASLLTVPRALGWNAWRRLALRFAAGAAPFLVVLVLFKVTVAWENDVVTPRRGAEILGHLFDPRRYPPVLAGLWHHGAMLGGGILSAAIVAVVVARWLVRRASPGAAQPRAAVRLVRLALLLVLLEYSMVYVITSWDQEEHLFNSLSRLLMQLWPGAIVALVVPARAAGAVDATPSDRPAAARRAASAS